MRVAVQNVIRIKMTGFVAIVCFEYFFFLTLWKTQKLFIFINNFLLNIVIILAKILAVPFLLERVG